VPPGQAFSNCFLYNVSQQLFISICKKTQTMKWLKQGAYHKSSEIDIKVTMNARHKLFKRDSCFADELKLKRVFVEYSQTKSLVGRVSLRDAIIRQCFIPLRVQRLVYCLCAKFR